MLGLSSFTEMAMYSIHLERMVATMKTLIAIMAIDLSAPFTSGAAVNLERTAGTATRDEIEKCVSLLHSSRCGWAVWQLCPYDVFLTS